jgi:parallel beta-helix repeat protein
LKDSEMTDVQLGVHLAGVDGYLMENCYIGANTDSIYAFHATNAPAPCYAIILRNNRLVVSNVATGNGFHLAYLNNSVIEDNYISGYTGYGISIGNSADTMIQRNRLVGAGTESIHADATNTKDTLIVKENIVGVGEDIGYTGCRLKNNRGFADRKVGQATILNGETTIVVTHGLSVTPDTCFLTPDTLGGLGTYAGFSVTTYGATTFTIESSRAVGENTEIFYDVFSRVNSLLC